MIFIKKETIAHFSFIILFFAGASAHLYGQKSVTLEDIWTLGSLNARSVPGFNFMKDGKHYTRNEGGNIEQYDLTSGQKVATIFDASVFKGKDGFVTMGSYTFNDNESQILILAESEPIFRHSSKEKVFLFDVKSKTLKSVSGNKKFSNTSFSPDGSKLAYTFDFNMYVYDLKTGKETQITRDGQKNVILNGMCDWVYEEEFSFTKAFEWNTNSDQIAFIRFDEREVPMFTMEMYNNDMYPSQETFKYPKVGEKNAEVTVHVYDVKTNKLNTCDLGSLKDIYVPRIKWTNSANQLCTFTLNRHQNDLTLYNYDTKSKKRSVLLNEKNKYYIEIHDDLIFLKDNSGFIWVSEKGGYNQVFYHDMNGKELRCLTPGQYDVVRMYGVDEKNKKAYYLAAEKSPMEHQVYEVSLDGTGKRLLTEQNGMNSAQFSSTFDYYVHTHSTINTPPTYTVRNRDGKNIRTIQDNALLSRKMKEYILSDAEFFKFKTSEGIDLNGYMIKPKHFNTNRKYPVFMFQYSGPGSQQVTDGWKGSNYLWFQHLAEKGYIVVCVDPRGTGARGEEFRKQTYMKLGHYETIDQIESAKYLASLPYVDGARIGIYGWSYGGYMSSLCILKGNDVFKAAIAVAPVINWKWYDTIYTERYMRTYKENMKGYDDNSPINFADRLKGKYLLVHGMADDNVHYQNAVEMSNALINANKQFDMVYYPNKNHGIFGGNARIHLFTKMTNFIIENL